MLHLKLHIWKKNSLSVSHHTPQCDHVKRKWLKTGGGPLNCKAYTAPNQLTNANRWKGRRIFACIMHQPGRRYCLHETKKISQLTPAEPTHSLTHSWHQRDFTQPRKPAHDQDLDSWPAFDEFALLKEHAWERKKNAAQEQPAASQHLTKQASTAQWQRSRAQGQNGHHGETGPAQQLASIDRWIGKQSAGRR